MKRWGKLLLAALLVGALGGGAVMFGLRGRRGEVPGPFLYVGEPLAAGAEARLTQGGWTLGDTGAPSSQRTLTRPPAPGQTRWLVFFGGNGAGYLAEARAVLEALDAGRGLGLAAVAPPGFDGSPGTPSPEALRAGAETAVRWLSATHQPGAGNIDLVGFSMGTGAALAAALALAKDGTPARSLVLLAPYARMDVTSPGLWGRLRVPDRYDNLSLASAGLPPARVLHGLADPALPASDGEQLARRLGGLFKGYPGVGHQDLLQHPAALDEVRAGLLP
nr:hypothetical protein asmbl_19 [uncultured bacterium]